MKNAEEVVFTLMFAVIPVVPNVYADKKIKIGLCFEWKRGLKKICIMDIRRALEGAKDTGLKPGSTWDLVVRLYSSKYIIQNILNKNRNRSNFSLLCSNLTWCSTT